MSIRTEILKHLNRMERSTAYEFYTASRRKWSYEGILKAMRSLVKHGFIRVSERHRGRSKVEYTLTDVGKRAINVLDAIQPECAYIYHNLIEKFERDLILRMCNANILYKRNVALEIITMDRVKSDEIPSKLIPRVAVVLEKQNEATILGYAEHITQLKDQKIQAGTLTGELKQST